jgi:rhodanese-related sulfurtransferase
VQRLPVFHAKAPLYRAELGVPYFKFTFLNVLHRDHLIPYDRFAISPRSKAISVEKGQAMMSFFKSSKPAAYLPVPEVAAAVAAGDMILIDVRDVTEVRATGKAQGAIHIPLILLAARADPRHPEHEASLSSPDRPVALYCASGARSQMAKQMLEQLGYTTVYNLGGLADWRAGGGAVVA